MESKNKKISVAICTYNGEKYIQEQLDSIIHQSVVPDEIVLGDDGSSDMTIKIATRILEASGVEYKILENSGKNLGVTANFSRTILACSGDIILLSDQDDVWFTNKVEVMYQCFSNNSKCVLTFSEGIITATNMDGAGEIWNKVYFNDNAQAAFAKGNYYDVLLSGNVVTGAAAAISKEFAKEIFPMKNPRILLHDNWIALCAPLFGDIVAIKAPLFYYRQHQSNQVGLRSNSMLKNIRSWLNGTFVYSKNDMERRLEVSRYFFEEMKYRMSEAEVAMISDWIAFNEWRKSLLLGNRIQAVAEVMGRAIKGDYKKYNHLVLAVTRDVLVCLFGKE